MSHPVHRFRLTMSEFCLLAGVTGAGSVIGIEDPWPDQSPEQIESALLRARRELAEYGLIEVRADERIVIEPRLAAAVSICGFPETVAVVTNSVPEWGVLQRYVHLTRGGAVELAERSDGPEPGVELLFFTETADALERMADMLRLEDQQAAGAASGQLRQALLESALGGARAEDLVQEGWEPGAASLLAQTLTAPRGNGSVAVLAPVGSEWQADGFGLLEGENALWRLGRPDGDSDVVTLESVSAEAVRQELRDLIYRHLPVTQS